VSGRQGWARALAPGALPATEDPRRVRFCSQCGAPTEHRVPQGCYLLRCPVEYLSMPVLSTCPCQC